jgi:hypothetical protein
MHATDAIDQRVTAGKIGATDTLNDRAMAIAIAVLNILNEVALGAQNKSLRRAERDMKWSEWEQITQNDS